MLDKNGETIIRNLEGRQALERDDEDGGRGRRKSTEIP